MSYSYILFDVGVIVASFFFFNDTATTEIYTLSLHDALPIYRLAAVGAVRLPGAGVQQPEVVVDLGDRADGRPRVAVGRLLRSEEHTSELQSRQYLVCRLLLEKKKKIPVIVNSYIKTSEASN